MLTECGFKILLKNFSMSYNLIPHDTESMDYRGNLMRATFPYPNKGSLSHMFTLPFISWSLAYTKEPTKLKGY